jgi:hypothetical protein
LACAIAARVVWATIGSSGGCGRFFFRLPFRAAAAGCAAAGLPAAGVTALRAALAVFRPATTTVSRAAAICFSTLASCLASASLRLAERAADELRDALDRPPRMAGDEYRLLLRDRLLLHWRFRSHDSSL